MGDIQGAWDKLYSLIPWLTVLGAFGNLYLLSRLARFKNDLQKDLQIHKAGIENSRLFFEKSYKACVKFQAINSNFTLRPDWPDMEYHEAVDRLADRLEELIDKLFGVMSDYYPVLSDEIVRDINNTIIKLNDARFERGSDELSDVGQKLVQEALSTISNLPAAIKTDLRNQLHKESALPRGAVIGTRIDRLFRLNRKTESIGKRIAETMPTHLISNPNE